MDQLATSADVAVAMGRDLTPAEESRVDPVLDEVSALFRRAARQLFTPGTSTVRLRVTGGGVYLPEHPVVSVAAVVDDDGAPLDYTRVGQVLTVDLASDAFATVTYSHGGEIPDLVRLRVASITRRILGIAEEASTGATSTTVTKGPFSTQSSYAAWAVGGQVMLSPDDVALAKSYRPVVPPRLIVMQP